MGSNNNSPAVPIFSENSAILMTEFRGLEIYASCAVAIYFYELIACGSKGIKWYNAKLWNIPEAVCFSLEKLTTIIYCIITLMFLHFTSHTQLSCTILLYLQQGFFALSTAFHCGILLIRFRISYPKRRYFAIPLFLLSIMAVLFLLMNILRFGNVNVNKLDGNCYLLNAELSDTFSIGFVMLFVYCWIIWAFIGCSIYSMRNLHYFDKSRYWRRILFDDGFVHLSLIALSQAINIVFIFDGKNYLRKYINITPLLILTSICTQRLLTDTKPFSNNNNESGNSLPLSSQNIQNIDKSQKYQDQQSLETFIDQFYLQEQRNQGYQQQRQTYNPKIQNQRQKQNYPQNQQQDFVTRVPSPTYSSFTTSTKVNSVIPSIPPIIIHKNASPDIKEEEVSYSYTDYDEKVLLKHLNERTTQDFGSSLLDYFNNIRLSSLTTPTNSLTLNRNGSGNLETRDSEQNNSRISKISRLSKLSMNNKERMSQAKLSQGMRKSRQQSQPILVDPNDIYYFTYSYDNDNEVYLFPAIQIQSDNSQEEEEGANNNERKSNESLTPPVHHQSFSFTGKIIKDDDNNDNSLDNKKIVRASVQNILSKEQEQEQYHNEHNKPYTTYI